MIWEFIAVCCFATVAAIIYNAVQEMYHWFSPDYINKKKLLRRIESLIVQETDTLNSPTAYPSTKTSALNRLNVLIMVKELIDAL